MTLTILSLNESETTTIGFLETTVESAAAVRPAEATRSFSGWLQGVGEAYCARTGVVLGLLPNEVQTVEVLPLDSVVVLEGDFVDIDATMKAIEQSPLTAPCLPDARAWVADAMYQAKEDSLKRLRLSRGFSQSEFAEAMGTSQATVSKWEAGLVDPRATTLAKMAAVLGVSKGEVCEAVCTAFQTDSAGNV